MYLSIYLPPGGRHLTYICYIFCLLFVYLPVVEGVEDASHDVLESGISSVLRVC